MIEDFKQQIYVLSQRINNLESFMTKHEFQPENTDTIKRCCICKMSNNEIAIRNVGNAALLRVLSYDRKHRLMCRKCFLNEDVDKP